MIPYQLVLLPLYDCDDWFPGATVTPVPNAQPDRRDGAIRKTRKPPIAPLIIEQPSPRSLQAERERREAKHANENIWAKAFADARKPRSEAVVPLRKSVDAVTAINLFGGSTNSEWEEELLLFGEELGLDAEVIL